MIGQVRETELNVRCKAAVVFDGDDTLWQTERLYDEARDRAREVIAGAGLNDAEWDQLQRTIDVESVAVLGFDPQRFPTSCLQAYERVCALAGVAAVNDVKTRIRSAAMMVFSADPPLMPGVHETLAYLKGHGARLALLTKGDFAVQERRMLGIRTNALRITEPMRFSGTRMVMVPSSAPGRSKVVRAHEPRYAAGSVYGPPLSLASCSRAADASDTLSVSGELSMPPPTLIGADS